MRRNPEHPNTLRRRSILLASAAGLFLFYLLCAAAAAVLCLLDLPSSALNAIVYLARAAACLCAGFRAGRRLRRGGMKTGLLCGLLTGLLIHLTAALLLLQIDFFPSLSALLSATGCGVLGGIWGVNTKNRYLSR